MERIIKRRLGDMLVESGKINMPQLQEALKKQRITGKKLGEVLTQLEMVTPEDIMEVLEKQTGIKRINLSMITFDTRALKVVPESVCVKHELIPFGFNENKIMIAMWDPLNIFAIDDVSIASGFEVESYISTKDQINKYIEMQYSGQKVMKAAQELSKEKIEAKGIQEQEDFSFDDIKNAPVVKMVDYLFKNAIEMRASDIHIEPFEDEIRIRYRIDGQLQTTNTLDIESQAALVTRIKILASLNIAEKRLPQDGRIITKLGNKDVDLRVSILPVVTGEKVVIRILDRDSYQIGKHRLGMGDEDLKTLDRIIKSPHGIILVTGPTGSGKSTTLYTVLNELNTGNVNIVTVEDPVEYTLKGVNQVNVNNKAGLTFAKGLRSILRQDPDVVMIGEIRDDETAEIAIRAAITGHLVLSTLHTNDAPSSVLRLIDMGVEPYLVSTSLAGVIAQRLVKKICPHCKESYEASDYEKSILGIHENAPLTLHKGEGCGFCNNTGYSGRVGIYEIMEITRAHKDLILSSQDSNKLKDLSIENGMRTLSLACKELVLKGETTLEELVSMAYLKE
ncbi:GspE/PulE family protein [Clostridium intestinale]|uniref:Type IV pilus assembly protein TapB n=1 Tax=Clostridium intestinale URNW TaxID=1294142 RepID=U2N9T5_9CLOT|nr:GspE/PulE family protein [Clostridium intestinale]ERK32277.1 type IV pilus assembly protein TapB [Clostridium intestinale URNW]